MIYGNDVIVFCFVLSVHIHCSFIFGSIFQRGLIRHGNIERWKFNEKQNVYRKNVLSSISIEFGLAGGAGNFPMERTSYFKNMSN